ncbi:MAG: AMP-binding protein [Gammaproteobacteria bacterium]|nr:AMP-binding protein [Gammaproteobacteria bacterium]
MWQPDPRALAGTTFHFDETADCFRINIPADANIAADTVGKHAHGERADHIALVFERSDGSLQTFSYRELDDAATRFAIGLRNLGVARGYRVAIHSAQRPETIIAHLASYKLGAIATTISPLSGQDTITYILKDSGAKVVVTHSERWEPFRDSRDDYQALNHVITSGSPGQGEVAFSDCLDVTIGAFQAEASASEDPALLIYTSGSTGQPKGILHAHRFLHALTSSLELFYNLELREPNQVFWTAADWAWVGGLNDVVFPALTFGHTLICSEHRFEPEWTCQFMGRHNVTHILLTPTALKRIARIENAKFRFDLNLKTIFTGGESLPAETHESLSENLGVVCNEGYGLTEVNQMIGNCQRLRPIRPGSMGWQFPARKVRLVDELGNDVTDGEVGEIVVSADDPTLFLGYWNQPELTQAMWLNEDWIRTHDLAKCDTDGYFWYQGRNDDLIKSAGFRIGPAEVEAALIEHPAVTDAGVIGVPDDEGDRGYLVKAFVSLVESYHGSDTLTEELRLHVKHRIGPHKQPRLIEYMDQLPTTSSGKVSRAELRQMHGETKQA